jgi:hypothetical protein
MEGEGGSYQLRVHKSDQEKKKKQTLARSSLLITASIRVQKRGGQGNKEGNAKQQTTVPLHPPPSHTDGKRTSAANQGEREQKGSRRPAVVSKRNNSNKETSVNTEFPPMQLHARTHAKNIKTKGQETMATTLVHTMLHSGVLHHAKKKTIDT